MTRMDVVTADRRLAGPTTFLSRCIVGTEVAPLGADMKVKLLIVQGRPEGKCLCFPGGEYVFGRGAECHVRPNSDWVSRQHCLLRVTSDGAYLRDLGSRNGTLINGVVLNDEHRLRHGDEIQVGPLVFEAILDEVESPSATLNDTLALATSDTIDHPLLPKEPDDEPITEMQPKVSVTSEPDA
jgi:pSer/pThr/pTyr-binding forkhead associated (FHA) protein